MFRNIGIFIASLALLAPTFAMDAARSQAEQVIALRNGVLGVHASDALIGYVQALVSRSRSHPGVRVGLSPRAGLALLRAARAHALLLGRSHALPEDVHTLFAAVAEHRRVIGAYELRSTVPDGLSDDELIGLFARDKKATREVTFVLDGPNGVEPVTGISDDLLRDALAAVR